MKFLPAIAFCASLGGASLAQSADLSQVGDFSPILSDPEANAYVWLEAGGVYFDLPEISANAVAVTDSGRFDLSPDLDHWGYTAGGEVGVRIGEVNGNAVWLRGSGFYSWAEADDTVSFAPNLGALAWQGIWGSNNWASVNATTGVIFERALGNNAVIAGTDNTGQIFRAAFSDLGSAYAFAGDAFIENPPSAVSQSVSYDSSVDYWGGELALALDQVVSPNGAIVSPFVGGLYRDLERDLTTTLDTNYSDGSLAIDIALSLHETLKGQYYGAVFGVDLTTPIGNGVTLDLSLSGAPLYLDADYTGYEANSFVDFENGVATRSGSATSAKLTDSEEKFAGLLRAGVGLGIPLFGAAMLELNGTVEYLTHTPTISRTGDLGASVSGETTAVAGTDPGGSENPPAPLASLDFAEMFAYSATARIVVPFGD